MERIRDYLEPSRTTVMAVFVESREARSFLLERRGLYDMLARNDLDTMRYIHCLFSQHDNGLESKVERMAHRFGDFVFLPRASARRRDSAKLFTTGALLSSNVFLSVTIVSSCMHWSKILSAR
uniref:Uncharacterized protein n=1 Tax=Odontella aurita TaxID=265563 RepID=A0A6U6CG06_9STRA|mmetsp:Transcript_12573/g.37099  ORF Transcript_12573/g.37099 Transcript_12573/m.37099 type:complete len:123 (+) Transcript_12573:1075-1443(+)